VSVTQVWKLDSPKMCRDFLKRVRFGEGKHITHLTQADGKEVSLDDASDEQLLQVANEIAEAIGKAKK
jgi:hypothetical protein